MRLFRGLINYANFILAPASEFGEQRNVQLRKPEGWTATTGTESELRERLLLRAVER